MALLAGSSRVQHLPMNDLGVQGRISITAATVADPYLLLHMSDGRAILLTADPTEGLLRLPPLNAEGTQAARIEFAGRPLPECKCHVIITVSSLA